MNFQEHLIPLKSYIEDIFSEAPELRESISVLFKNKN